MELEAGSADEGAVRGVALVLLRSEGLALLALAVFLYWSFGRSWLLFILLFLAPDASMLGYLGGKRTGSLLYNLFHTYLAPGMLGLLGVLSRSSFVYSLALIWFAHIGLDRAIGYGLKYPEGFRFTHLGRIGRQSR